MDPDSANTPALSQQMQEIERWLRNPNPFELFESMLYEVVERLRIVGDAFWYVTEDNAGPAAGDLADTTGERVAECLNGLRMCSL